MAARFDIRTSRTQTRPFAPAVSKGERSAQMTETLPRLWRFALRLCAGHRHAAERLVQRACAQTFERNGGARADLPLWLDQLRGMHAIWRGERMHAANDDAHDAAVPSPLLSIVDAVGRLPDAQRVALLLVEIEGLNDAEAAYVLNISSDALASRIRRPRQTPGAQFARRDGMRRTGAAACGQAVG